MMKQTAILASTILLFAGLLAGCSGSNTMAPTNTPTQPQPAQTQTPTPTPAKEPQVLRMNLEEPSTLDPALSEDVISGAVIRAMFDGLTRLDKEGKPVNSIATDVKLSADKKTYTFTLRDSQWTNGDPITAKDFAYSWIHTLDPKTGSGSAYQYYSIKNAVAFNGGKAKAEDVGIKALDDKTLEVTLENPTPYFLTLVSFYYPMNQKVVEANKEWANDPKTIVSNGPFKLETWKHKSKLILVKNNTYWDKDSVKLEKIDFSMIEDANTELAMFDNNELDWAGQPLSGLPVDAVLPLNQEGKLVTKAKATTFYIRFQTEKIPFTNEKVRKAFAYAINRKEIADNIGQAGQTPLLGFVPKSASLKPEGFFKDNDVETAKKLLVEGMKELGITKLPEITFLFNTSERNKKIAEAMQAQWKTDLGVDVKLLNKETKVYLDDQEQGKFEITRSSWTGDYNDPINFLEKFIEKYSSSNITRWYNQKYTDLIKKSYAEPDETKRKQILLEAETILMSEMPLTGIFSDVNAWVQNEKVKGVQVDPLGYIDFKWGYKE